MRLHLSALLRLLDEQTDLLGRVNGLNLSGCLLAERAQDDLRRSVEEIRERFRDQRE